MSTANITIMPADFKEINARMQRLRNYLNTHVYDVIGTESVKFYRKSFEKQGFTDKGLKKWKEVERRKPGSSWYGFKHGSKRNFSDAATKRPILSGETQELINSIQYRPEYSRRRVVIFSDKVYAQIQNEGGDIRVFGKGSATIPARKFMGSSQKLEEKITSEIVKDLTNILK